MSSMTGGEWLAFIFLVGVLMSIPVAAYETIWKLGVPIVGVSMFCGFGLPFILAQVAHGLEWIS